MEIEEIAKSVVIQYGTKADFPCIYTVMAEMGFHDEDGSIANEIWDLVQNAIVRVKFV